MKAFIGILLVAFVAFSSPVPAPVSTLAVVPDVPIAVAAATPKPTPQECGRGQCGVPQVSCIGRACRVQQVGGASGAVYYEFPWVVQIYSNGRHICGGSIIDANHILTAASCLEPSANSRANPQTVAALQVVWGQYKLVDPSDLLFWMQSNVSVAYLHAQYKPPTPTKSPVYDIAVLKLVIPAVFSLRAQPICLDDGTSYNIDTGKFKGIVAGYRTTSYNTLSNVSVLHNSNVTVMTPKECRIIYSKYNYTIRGEQICAGVPTKDSCVSDLGGPLFNQTQGNFYIQSGIASFGISCKGPPAVFTRVSSFKPWIDSVRRAKDNLSFRVFPEYYEPFQTIYAK